MADYSGDRTPQGADAIRQIMDRFLADTHTAIPAIIEDFDRENQTVDCIPMVRRVFRGEDSTRSTVNFPKLVRVPLVLPFVRTAGMIITLPIKPGDTCLLVFSERGLDNWQDTGGISDPPENIGARRHHLTDGLAILAPIATPDAVCGYNPDDLEVRNGDRTTLLRISQSDAELRASGGEALLNTPVVRICGDAIIQGDLVVDGEITQGGKNSGIAFSSHVHGGVQTGGSNTLIPSGSPGPGPDTEDCPEDGCA